MQELRYSMSRSGSEESINQRTLAISVIRDTGSKVELMLKAHGLRKRKSLLNSIVTFIRKRILCCCFQPHQPSKLLANGKFSTFELTASSLTIVLEVQTEKKKKKGNGNRTDVFKCNIKKFPSRVNPESAEFEVLEPASGESFILLSLVKLDNLNINWRDFLSENSTLDVEQI